jgi:phosphopantetheinyl transferase
MWQERLASTEQLVSNSHCAGTEASMKLSGYRHHRARVAARRNARALLHDHLPWIDHASQLHIESRDGCNRPTRPQVFVDGQLAPWDISLSHTERFVVAAIVPIRHGRLGVDLLELEVPVSPTISFWLSKEEAERSSDPFAAGLVWSLKEAFYKATNEGTPFCPRRIDTSRMLSPQEWVLIERGLRDRAVAALTLSTGYELSLKVVQATLKTVVFRPAGCHPMRVPA